MSHLVDSSSAGAAVSPTASYPVTDRVRHALSVSRRGCDELLPENDWLTKLARSEATGVPLRIKLGLDPTAPDIHIGHTVPFTFTKWLQDVFDVPLVIMLTGTLLAPPFWLEPAID